VIGLEAVKANTPTPPAAGVLTAAPHATGEVVLTNELDGTISSWSLSAERLFGYRADEIVGRSLAVLTESERVAEVEGLLTRVRRGELIEQFETVRRRKDGTAVHLSLSITPIQSASGEILGASVVAFDISERKTREEIRCFLLEARRLLTASFNEREVVANVADLMLSGLAEWCIVEAVGPEAGIAHRDPADAELAHRLRQIYAHASGRGDIRLGVFASRTGELITDASDAFLRRIAQSPGQLRALREIEPTSLIVVPLRPAQRMLGRVILATTASGRRFSRDDLALAEDLARWIALALDNAMLHESERQARHTAERAAARIGGLQLVTAALSRASTPSEVAEVFMDCGAAAVGACGGFVRLLTLDGRRLELAASKGLPEEFGMLYGALPLDSTLPGADAFSTGGARYFESAAAIAASPEFETAYSATGHEAMAFIALLSRRPIGLIAFSFAEPRTFDDDDREFLDALASLGSQALERALLYEAEQRARADVELARERTTCLQRVGAELAQALTPAQVARVILAQGIAILGADRGRVKLVPGHGKTCTVVSDGLEGELVEEEWEHFSVEREPSNTTASRPTTSTCIPLICSGRSLGALFLTFTQPRTFSESQRSFVVVFSDQCAQALRRAQLYEAEHEGRSELSRLVERLHEGVVSVERGGRVVFASSRARHMLGPGLQEGCPVPEVWLGFPLRLFVADLFDSDAGVVEDRVVNQRDGRVFDLTGIPSTRSEAVLVVVTDVSAREWSRRAEREFVDNAAHELQTPLAAITGAIERLQAGAREVPERRDRFLGHIQHESARLNRLAASLLMLSRAQAGQEQPRHEDIALRGLLVALIDSLAPSPGVELVLECPPDLVARTNRDLLEHALLNLYANAARHTASGQILTRVRDEGAYVVIEIDDTGCGIPPADLAHIFKRFYRGSGVERRTGAGLGLAIAQEAVRALGGRIEIDSVPGAGTTARILLPRVAAVNPA
jgi:PAS domain S-box-containing protein